MIPKNILLGMIRALHKYKIFLKELHTEIYKDGMT